METALAEIDLNEPCPKCGWDSVSVTYCKGPSVLLDCWGVVRGEHFHRTCGRCGYFWLEDFRRLFDQKILIARGRSVPRLLKRE